MVRLFTLDSDIDGGKVATLKQEVRGNTSGFAYKRQTRRKATVR